MTHAEAVLRSLSRAAIPGVRPKPPYRIELALEAAGRIDALCAADRHQLRHAITTATADLVAATHAVSTYGTARSGDWSFSLQADPGRRVVRVSRLCRDPQSSARAA